MSPAKKPRGIVLRWQALLIAELVAVGPPNQTRILAVAAACVSHANPDGGRMEAGIRRLARETGQYVGRVSEALDWLIEEGWLTLDRRLAHGLRRFRLTIPQSSGDSNAGSSSQSSGDSNAGSSQSSAQSSAQSSGDNNEPPTSDLLGGGGGGESSSARGALDPKDKSSDSNSRSQHSATTKPTVREVAVVRRWLDDLQEVSEIAEEEGTVYGWRNFPFDRVQRDEPKLVAEIMRLQSWGDLGALSISDRWHSPPAAEKINHPARWLAHFLNRFPDEPEQATG